MANTLFLRKLFENTPILNVKQAVLSAPVRHVFMNAVVWFLAKQKGHKDLEFNVLEIGSWMGASMLTWTSALDSYNDGEGSITCVDAWEPFFSSEEKETEWYKEMDQLLESDFSYNIFCHNLSCVSNKIKKQHFRGKSEAILPLVKINAFDVVYVDGDHSYKGAKSDIVNSKDLVKEGGIICGDDLNLQFHECDSEFVINNAHRDFLTEPTKNKNIHPGVTLAVYEEFGEVSSWAGFWAMRKTKLGWEKIDLLDMPIVYPSHLPDDALKRAQSHINDLIKEKKLVSSHAYE